MLGSNEKINSEVPRSNHKAPKENIYCCSADTHTKQNSSAWCPT